MNHVVSKMLRHAKRPVAAALIALMTLGPAHAAAPVVSSAFQPVLIDGSVAPAADGVAFNVIYDGSVLHLWYRTGGTNTISDIRHATSTDGINFTTDTGAFTFTADPFAATPPAPLLYYDAVSNVGGTYKIIHWTGFGDEGGNAAYNTNNSVSDIGATASNSVLTHLGAITGGTPGNTNGAFGIEAGTLVFACGLLGGQTVCSSPYTNGTPPSTVSPPVLALDATALFTSLGIPTGYINNHGDLRADGVGLEIAFTVRDGAGGRFNQQVYFSESSDNGVTFSAPVALLTSPPTLDGPFGPLPGANFAHAELLRLPGNTVLYVSTTNQAGNSIIAVSGEPITASASSATPVPGLGAGGIAALLALLSLLAVPVLRRRRSTTR